ncbi:hypothetical protein Pta02_03930 [Planobispora takensis]|uniref:Uncharacterized protein n=1 Tax=Planobispora takensis TaxID=1367882 RepID=A0A8J3SS78_9ACTN|nr:hypothetical protein Pta02_03930 [Planobispora takensis]
MELFLEVIAGAAVIWWLCRCAVRSRRDRRAGPPVSGSHDAGVWVNPGRWAQIVAELDPEGREQRPRRPE